MAIRQYNIQFKDKKERLVKVEIVNTLLATGDLHELTPSAEPLTISEDDDHDPLKPVRATVAQIRVRCTHDELIPIADNMQWAVTIKRASTTIWRGFLRAEMPDSDFSAMSDEAYYTADDILGALQYQKKNFDGSKKLLAQLLAAFPSLMDNSTPIRHRDMLPATTFQQLMVESQNWLENEENSEGVTETVQPVAEDVEHDILQWLGLTERYYNDHLYIGSLFGTKFYNGANELSLDVLDGSQFQWRGFHTLKMEQGVGRVSVSASGQEIEDVSIPQVTGDNYDVKSIGWLAPQTQHDTSLNALNCYVRELSARQNTGVVLYAYTSGTPGNVFGRKGANALDVDVWRESSSSPKTNFAFSRGILLVGVGLNMDGTHDLLPTFQVSDDTTVQDVYQRARAATLAGLTQPLVTVTSKGAIYAKDGGFTLKLETRAMTINTIQQGGNTYRQLAELGSTSDVHSLAYVYAVCSVRHGSKWWTGSAWSNTPTKFFYTDNECTIKTLEMMFQGGTAAMPVSGTQGGEVEFCLYGIYGVYQWDEGEPPAPTTYYCAFRPEELALLTNISLTYNPPLDLLEPSNGEEIKLNQYTAGMPDDNSKDVELHLCSDGDVADNWGFVFYGNDIIKTMHWPKLREDWMPERFVLKKNVLALSSLRSYATLSIECEYEHIPFRRVSLAGRTWYPLAVTTDVQRCQSDVLMMDITDIMAALPPVGTDEEASGHTRLIYVTCNQFGDVTWTLAAPIDEQLMIDWATSIASNVAVIDAGDSDVTDNVGEVVQELSDFTILNATTASGTYTFMFEFQH